MTNRIPSDGLPVIGGTFNTVIGFIFLAIVIVSPDGLMGLWDRMWDALAGAEVHREVDGRNASSRGWSKLVVKGGWKPRRDLS